MPRIVEGEVLSRFKCVRACVSRGVGYFRRHSLGPTLFTLLSEVLVEFVLTLRTALPM